MRTSPRISIVVIALALLPIGKALPVESAFFETLILRRGEPDEQQVANVYLPPAYKKCRKERFPVLYLPYYDGRGEFFNVMRTVHNLTQRSRLRDTIVVGIKMSNSQARPSGKVSSPSASSITSSDFDTHAILPVIQKRYRLSGETATVFDSRDASAEIEGLFPISGRPPNACSGRIWRNRPGRASAG